VNEHRQPGLRAYTRRQRVVERHEHRVGIGVETICTGLNLFKPRVIRAGEEAQFVPRVGVESVLGRGIGRDGENEPAQRVVRDQ
jgi:hypothetical protein